MIEASERESQLAQLKNLNGADKAGGYHLADKGMTQHNENETILSTSLNYIKNKTGEILLFKTGRQPAHTEMQANEPILPLDFQKNQIENTSHHLSGTEETDRAGTLFDGVASSEMQPDSEAATFY